MTNGISETLLLDMSILIDCKPNKNQDLEQISKLHLANICNLSIAFIKKNHNVIITHNLVISH